MTNLIYLGNFADVDPYENDYDAERGHDLVGISADHTELRIVGVQQYDHEKDGVISDNEHTCDYIRYDAGSGTKTNQTDSSLTGYVDLTLSDGSTRSVEVVIIQQDNGDLFITDLLNCGTLDNLSVCEVEITSITNKNASGWYANQSVDNTVIAPKATEDGYVDGTSDDDTIVVDAYVDGDGDEIDDNDAILPGEGAQDDIVIAGAGDDLVMAKDGSDEIYGGDGDDTLCGQDGDDTIFGGAGNDILEGMNDNDLLFGNDGDDRIMGDAGDDVAVGHTGDDSITGGSGDDVIHGGLGDDTIHAGGDNDLVYGGGGADSIKGGSGDDVIYGAGRSADTVIDFDDLSGGELVDGQFLASGVTIYSADPRNPAMVFDSDNPTGGDHDLGYSGRGNILILSEDRDGDDPDDEAHGGTFVIEFDGPAQVDSLDFLDIETGATIRLYDADGNVIDTIDVASTSDNGETTAHINQSGVVRMEVDLPGSGAIDNLSFSLDGNAEDAGDDIAAGSGDDVVFGGAGNDEISGGTGNDTLEGNAGDDSISGDDGNDVIYGDNSDGGAAPGRESFEWDLLSEGEVDSTATQDTGSVTVTYTRTEDAGSHFTNLNVDTLNTDGIDSGGETVDTDSGLKSETDGQDGAGEFQFDFSEPVENVSFNVNDIDGDGVVRVTAFDALGNPIEVILTGGDNLTLLDTDTVAGADTADSEGGYQPVNSPLYNLNVTIPGPVSRIVVEHDQDGANNSGIRITDIYFDGVADGEGGDDVIDGGTGDDVIYGQEGDDTITSGDGADTVFGGADRDVIFGSAGDTVDGGAEGDDFDTLDLSGQGPFFLTGPDGTGDPVPDSNGNGIDGRVTFVDGNGEPTGEIIDFTEIEKVIGDEINRGPEAEDDGFDADEDDDAADLGNVLGNDSDPDGDTLTVGEVNGDAGNVGQPVDGSDGGTFVINADGSISFDPDGDFESLGVGDTATTTIEYTVDDGNGGTDTATVTVTVSGQNDAPVAVDNAYTATFSEDSGDTDGNVITDDTGSGVDSDVDGDDLTVVGVGQPSGNVGTPVAGSNGGLFTINADGTVDFDADGDFDGLGLNDSEDTSVTYTISDGNGGTDTATVTVTVTGINNGTVEGTAGDDVIDLGYTDADGDQLDGNDAILPGDTGNDDLVYGFEGDDRINARDGDDEVYGGTGNDTVNGNAGNDTLFGDEDDDKINGGSGNDTAFGGDGNDIVSGQGGDDTLSGGAGDDMINGGAGDDSLAGNAGNDKIEGSAGDDTIRGGDGEDDLWGGLDEDTIFGGDDDDTVDGGAGNDTLDGGEGDDSIQGGTGDDSIQGGTGDDDIDGGTGDDSITSGIGNDTVEGGDGDDVINAGNHVDPAFDYDYPGSVPPGFGFGDNDPNPDNDLDTVFGGAGNDTITTGDDDDTVFGGTGNDTIDLGIDDDSAQGGDGNDTIIGSQGEDVIEGNDGDDLIYGGLETEVLDLPDAIDPAPDDNRDTLFGGAGNDKIYGRDDTDTLFGGAGDDLLDGGIDNDSLNGGTGDDTLFGGQGDDTITGQVGDDTVFGGDGNDILGGGIGNFSDTVYGDAGDDIITGGDGNDELFGGTGNDEISGNGGADTIDGGDGDDSIQGSDGDDLILGGDGADTIRANVGSDSIEGGAGNDFIIAGDNPFGDFPDDVDPDPFDDRDVVDAGDGDDVVRTGDDSDTIFGGAGNDVLNAGIDDDRIEAGDGNDTIIGGDGEDELFGGFGSDTFIGGNGGDTVVGGEDPDNGDIDVLDLRGAGVDFIDYDDPDVGGGADDDESGRVYFNDGTTMTFEEIENVIPCFTPGTMIATPKGERPVEELVSGDKVITRDNGIQEIAWVGHKFMDGKQLAANPHLKPILIKAGSLGGGLPERDMLVSPNHRVLVASELTQLYFEEREVLAAAKHMTGAEGIHAINAMNTTYVHFMFERHEVVLSNGAWTESFQPGDYSLKGIGNSQRNEIFELFPDLATAEGRGDYTAARRMLKKHEARLLMR